MPSRQKPPSDSTMSSSALPSHLLRRRRKVCFLTKIYSQSLTDFLDHVNLSTDSSALAGLTMQKTFAEKWRALDPSSATTIHVLPSVEEAFDYVRDLSAQNQSSKDSGKVHTLITGSVHLIGRALGILESAEAL